MSITDQLVSLRDDGLSAIAAATDLAALDAVRVEYLGKKGSLTGILRGLGTLPADERPAAGKVSNEVRVALEAALEERHATLACSRARGAHRR